MARRTAWMMMTVALVMAGGAEAQDHFHMTVDTMDDMGEPTTVIRAGYLASESLFSIVDGRLMYDGSIAVVELADQIPSGTFAGYFGGADMVLTSDYYFSTGRLTGGDFSFELVQVDVLAGPDPRVVWVHSTGPGAFQLQADSDAVTRTGRSYHVGIGGHQHAQLALIEHEGLYDVTFIAWDANGVYEDSEAVVVRFQAGEPVICLADVNGDGMVTPADFTAWINAFNSDAPECDQNGDGTCSPADFTAWIANYNAGC